MAKIDFNERGQTVWFSSEDEGGPDCGISVGLGNDQSLYFGEMSDTTLAANGIDTKETGDGWWLVLFAPDNTRIVGPLNGSEDCRIDAQEIAEAIAAALQPPPPQGEQPAEGETA